MRSILFLFILFFSSTLFAQEKKLVLDLDEDTESYDADYLSSKFHKQNRVKLRNKMPDNSVAVFFANPIRNRSNDIDFEYHQDPNFYYLTGFNESNSILIIFSKPKVIDGEKVSELLFVPKKDPSKEMWLGNRLGQEKAQNELGITKVYSTADFRDIDLKLEEADLISYSMNTESLKDDPFQKEDMYNLRRQFEAKLFKADDDNIKRSQYVVWMSKLREEKTKEELMLMRKAIDITCEAQKELMRALKPGMKEYQSEAIVEFIFKLRGAEYPGFPSIEGSGANSCVLHYQTNRKQMIGANLLVSDVGAEYHGYTADVTRTLPVDGKFSEEEAILYNLVLKAQNDGIAVAQVGANFWDTNIAATTTISQGLMKLGIIESPIELKRYFMHGTSHYLGLDVHDVGTYGKLKENTVITVEPGIYIAEGSPCDKKWWNIGIRIEDDILITKDGPENLSDCIPRSIEEIEQLMQEKSFLNK